jgi:hypothetical protein
MRSSHAVSLIAALGLAVTLQALAIDVSDKRLAKQVKSLSVTTSDVVFVQTRSHGAAVVQFTHFDMEGASYRWRYRPSSGQKVLSGTGRVTESFERERMPDGSYRVSPRSDHATLVKAGEISFEWSAGDKTKGWVYYDPDRATVRLLPVEAFDKDI